MQSPSAKQRHQHELTYGGDKHQICLSVAFNYLGRFMCRNCDITHKIDNYIRKETTVFGMREALIRQKHKLYLSEKKHRGWKHLKHVLPLNGVGHDDVTL